MAFLATFSCGATYAATPTPPNISDALRQVPPPMEQVKPPAPMPSAGAADAASPDAKAAGPTLKVVQFKITGNKSVDSETLHQLVAQDEGKMLAISELERVVARITFYYRSQGYFMARAYLPAQEIRKGVVTIGVVEGEYGKFILENKSLVDDSVIQDILGQVHPGDPITAESLEKRLAAVNDLPGAVVSSTSATKGQTAGSSDFVISTAPTPRIVGSFSANNYGSIYTGKNIMLLNADVNSPTGAGDKISTQTMMTTNRNLQNYRLAYSRPLTPNGLRGEVAASKTNYQLAGPFKALDAMGEAQSLEATLTYPIMRDQGNTLDGSLQLVNRQLEDQIRSTSTITPKEANALTATLTASQMDALFGFPGKTIFSGGATIGSLDIKEAGAASSDAAGAKTEGRYGKVNFTATRVTFLELNWRLTTALKMQRALFSKNLDGSEDMSISGISGVKAYPPGEFSAENAYIFNAEIQYTLPVPEPFSLRSGLFFDTGHASMERPIGTSPRRTLSDVGVGLYGNYDVYFFTLQLAHSLTAPATSEEASPTRTFLQVGRSF